MLIMNIKINFLTCSLFLISSYANAQEHFFIYAKHSDNSDDKTTIVNYIGEETDVVIPKSVTTIEHGAFAGHHLISVTIPESVTFIGEMAFSYNNLTDVTIPNSVIIYWSGGFWKQ